ncbi:MAG: hypothetical protein U9P68_03905 [Pseudomonadota bacterium]|nr:hypothetical protein [Pseudomonadota bacterium]
MRFSITKCLRTAGIGLALAAACGPALANDATGLIFGERQLALDLDTRCDLFTPAQRAALEAGRLQARGSLLRDGVSVHALEDYAAEIEAQARATDCRRQDVAELRARIADAFAGWQRLRDMTFSGAAFDWTATRSYIAGEPVWAALQDTGEVRVGLSRIDDRIRFTAAMPATAGAVSAVLVLRDIRREPDLYDPTLDGHFPAPAGAEWADWTPPDYARTLVWTSGRGTDAERSALTRSGAGLVFHFPDSAMAALETRDPREAARIELIDGQGRIVGQHYFEIGDFGAARAFVRSGNLVDPRS